MCVVLSHQSGVSASALIVHQSFDTANTYSAGESEVILGKFLKQHKIPRESVVILTKTFNTDGKLEDKGPSGWANHQGLSRKVSGSYGERGPYESRLTEDGVAHHRVCQ